jgi:hypothetical protein
MEEPGVKTISDIITESVSEHVVDMYTESELLVSSKQMQSDVSISNQKQSMGYFQEFKPMTIQKKDTSMLSLFKPMFEQKQKDLTLSDIKQEQSIIKSFDVIPFSATVSISLQTRVPIMKKAIASDIVQSRVLISETAISNKITAMIDTIILRESPFEEEIRTTVPIIPSLEEEIQQMSGPQSYILKLRNRQYRNGKRIDDRTYHPRSSPLSFDDAMSLGVNIVSNSEKASFELEESSEKPQKLGKHVEHWTSKIAEYNQTKENRWVEDSRYRIDSPGELREITMKGVEARMRR